MHQQRGRRPTRAALALQSAPQCASESQACCVSSWYPLVLFFLLARSGPSRPRLNARGAKSLPFRWADRLSSNCFGRFHPLVARSILGTDVSARQPAAIAAPKIAQTKQATRLSRQPTLPVSVSPGVLPVVLSVCSPSLWCGGLCCSLPSSHDSIRRERRPIQGLSKGGGWQTQSAYLPSISSTIDIRSRQKAEIQASCPLKRRVSFPASAQRAHPPRAGAACITLSALSQ
jgi:hypothetical protein